MSQEILTKRRDDVQKRPDSVEAWYQLAAAAAAAGALGEAHRALERVIELAPDHADAHRALANVRGRLGDAAGAIAAWRRVVALAGPADLDAGARLGIALSSLGQHEEAIECLSQVAAGRPAASAHADLGMAFIAAGRLDEALTALARVRDLEPDSPQAQCGLGLVYQQRRQWRQAADAFRKAEQLAPASAVGPYNLALALEALGDHEQALQALMRASARAPGDQAIRDALDELAVPQVVDDEITLPASARADDLPSTITGDLARIPLLEVLDHARVQRRIGALVVSSPRGTAVVRLVRGRITSASAPGVKRLGDALVEQAGRRAEALKPVIARDEAADRDEVLGNLLLREALVDGPQLGEAISRRIMASLDELLDWTEGAFTFDSAEDELAPPISFDLQELALRLVKLREERRVASGGATEAPARE